VEMGHRIPRDLSGRRHERRAGWWRRSWIHDFGRTFLPSGLNSPVGDTCRYRV